MLKKFLHGLAFGAGFAVAFLGVWAVSSWGFTMWFVRGESDVLSSNSEIEIDAAPALSEARGFLGSQGSYSGDPDSFRRNGTLAEGPGKIVGKVTSNGAPVEGLRLRLALNGSVMSAWVTTDEQGTYTINVPFGRYRIDGYELAMETANRVLDGKIDRPRRRPFDSAEFDVASGTVGEGLPLDYVDPVELLGPTGTVSSRDAVVLAWAPYPGADRYRIQLYEVQSADAYSDRDDVFDLRSRPEVTGTSFDLTANGITLKNGHSYAIEVEARDAAGRALATTARAYGRTDFRVVD